MRNNRKGFGVYGTFISPHQRAARDDDGERTRIPSDMNYRDWKAIYIDKTKALAEWQAEYDASPNTPTKAQLRGRAIIEQLADKSLPLPKVNNNIKVIPKIKVLNYEDVAELRSPKDFMTIANQLKPIIEQYTVRPSKWNGKFDFTSVDDKGGGKLWDYSIRLNPDVPIHVLIHEMIHSCSVSHYGLKTYVKYKSEEELTTHFLSQELATIHGFDVADSVYDSGINLIREFKLSLDAGKTDLEFAAELIRQPLGERWDWLWSQIADKMNLGASMDQGEELINKLEAIKQWNVSA